MLHLVLHPFIWSRVLYIPLHPRPVTLPHKMISRQLRAGLVIRHRQFHSSVVRTNRALFDPKEVERATDDVDVCIVGGGPAGLSAAIRLKQLEQENGKEVRVVVLEKGPEVGSCLPKPSAHNLRGC